MKTITFFSVLMQLAREEGICEQRLLRDPFQSEVNKKAYEDAKIAHENYRQLCLKSDEMITPR